MSFTKSSVMALASVFTLLIATLNGAVATTHGGMKVINSYAIAASSTAQSGAIFMQIINHTSKDDQLLSVASDIAARVEIHEHLALADGVMRMQEVAGGITITSKQILSLQRGGHHVMLMGLNRPLVKGESFELTLNFQHAGSVTITIPIRISHPEGADHTKMGD
ncbi:MAG: copper chaperone PCu(A)C [Paracoccaceae bacterium]|jgi:copper(I)-binding protein